MTLNDSPPHGFVVSVVQLHQDFSLQHANLLSSELLFWKVTTSFIYNQYVRAKLHIKFPGVLLIARQGAH